MTPNIKEKTRLEGFFNPQIAANAPQTLVSTALLDVLVSFSKLVDVIFAITRNVPENVSDTWTTIGRRAATIEGNLKREFTMADTVELTSFLNELGNQYVLLKNGNYTELNYQAIATNFRKVLISLILFAKESEDLNFKAIVLGLAKRWEEIS